MNQEIKQDTIVTRKKLKEVVFFTTIIFPLGMMVFMALLVTFLGGVNLVKDNGYVFLLVRGGQTLFLGVIVSTMYFIFNYNKYL